MATIKSYTDINQSRKLVEILPFESADMYYPTESSLPKLGVALSISNNIPCWSLAALLSVIPYNVSFNKAVYRFKLVKFPNYWECYHESFGCVSTEVFKANNPIDVCYQMIIKLNELNLL